MESVFLKEFKVIFVFKVNSRFDICLHQAVIVVDVQCLFLMMMLFLILALVIMSMLISAMVVMYFDHGCALDVGVVSRCIAVLVLFAAELVLDPSDIGFASACELGGHQWQRILVFVRVVFTNVFHQRWNHVVGSNELNLDEVIINDFLLTLHIEALVAS